MADNVKVLDYYGVERKPLSLGTSNDLIKAALLITLHLPMMSRLLIIWSRRAYCLWEQVMNLSAAADHPSIADDCLLIILESKATVRACLIVERPSTSHHIEGHSHILYIQECQHPNTPVTCHFEDDLEIFLDKLDGYEWKKSSNHSLSQIEAKAHANSTPFMMER
jgi:hypothetical protein